MSDGNRNAHMSMSPEMWSGWVRTGVTAISGALMLAGATWTVTSTIAGFEHKLDTLSKTDVTMAEAQTEVRSRVSNLELHYAPMAAVDSVGRRLSTLEKSQLPSGIERSKLAAAIDNLQTTLTSIDRRLGRLEDRRDGALSREDRQVR